MNSLLNHLHLLYFIELFIEQTCFVLQGLLDETTGKADIWVTKRPAQEGTLVVSYLSQTNLVIMFICIPKCGYLASVYILDKFVTNYCHLLKCCEYTVTEVFENTMYITLIDQCVWDLPC